MVILVLYGEGSHIGNVRFLIQLFLCTIKCAKNTILVPTRFPCWWKHRSRVERYNYGTVFPFPLDMVIYTKTVRSLAKMLSCHENKLNRYIYAYFQKLQMRKIRISLWKCWNYFESLRFIVLRLENFIHIKLIFNKISKWRYIIHESSALQAKSPCFIHGVSDVTVICFCYRNLVQNL